MSYILDALKKKETESSDAVPDIKSQHYHAEFEEESLPVWKYLLIGLGFLSVAAVIYLAYSLGQTRVQNEAEVATVTPVENEEISPPVLQQPEVKTQDTELQVESKPIALKPAVVEKVSLSQPVFNQNTVVNQQPVETTTQLSSPARNSSPLEVISDDFSGLPAMRYNTHVYADSPQDRFVMLNGKTYSIGNRLPNGVKIEDILEDDLLISFQGRSYQIPSLTDVNQ